MKELRRLFVISLLFFVYFPVGNIQAAFRFASWSDAQDQGVGSAATAGKIAEFNPLFTIFNGDFSDRGVNLTASDHNSMQWMANSVSAVFEKTFFVRGNHDSSRNNPQDWQRFFVSYPEGKGTMADRVSRIGGRNYSFMAGKDNLTYSFDYENARFLMIDSTGDSSDKLTADTISWIDSRLTDAETNHSELVHAFLSFHGPYYCLTDQHCDCSRQKAACFNNVQMSLVTVFNKHPIVTATFHGHEHVLGWTHLDKTRIGNLNNSFEQFVTAPSGRTYFHNSLVQFNSSHIPYRFDYVDTAHDDQAFGIIDVNGLSYTVSLYRKSLSNPVWTQTFTKTGIAPTITPTLTPTATLTSTPSPTAVLTVTPTVTPTSSTTTPTSKITPTPIVSICEERQIMGDYDCSGSVNQNDFSIISSDLALGKDVLKHFEYWRRVQIN